MNKILEYIIKKLKSNFERNNKELKESNYGKYEQKLEKYIFNFYLALVTVITLIALLIYFNVMQLIS